MRYIYWSGLAAWMVIWCLAFVLGTSPLVIYAQIALCIYCLGIGFLLLLQSNATPFCWVFFWMFHAYFIFIPSLATYVSKISTWGTVYTLDDYGAGYMIYTAWLAATVAGYAYWRPKIRLRSRPPNARFKSNMIIGVLSFPLIATVVAFPTHFVASREEIADLTMASDTLGYLLIGSKMLFLSAAVYALNFWKGEKHAVWTFLRIVLSLLILLVFNPFTNPRFMFLGADLAIASSWLPIRRRSLIVMAVLAPIFIFFMLPLTKVIFNKDALSKVASKDTKDYLVSTEFDAFQQSMNSAIYVSKEGYNYGSQLLGAVVFWVPRAIFPEKPEPSGFIVADYMGYQYLNLALPLYAEWYLAIGLPGVLAFGFLCGIVLRTVDAKGSNFDDPNNAKSFWRLDSLLIGSFSFIIYRGSLGAVSAPIGAMTLGVIILFFATRVRFKGQ